MAADQSPSQDPTDEPGTAGGARSDDDKYISHRERLLAGGEYYARSYDKWLLTLSGGALALSMALCKEVLGGTPQGTWWLLVSWILFGAGILCILSCILLAQVAYEKDGEVLDALYRKQEEDWQAQVYKEQDKQRRRTVIGWLNKLSLFCFTAGLCLLAYFASLNMVKNGKNNDGKKLEAGDVTAAETRYQPKTQE